MVLSLYKWLAVSLAIIPFATITSKAVFPLQEGRELHPFFVSITEINHNAKDKELEISCRIFTDDFEKTLTAAYKTKIDILHPADKKKVEGYINDYISKHLQIKVDGKAAILKFIGYEQQEEAIWNYFEIKDVATLKTIEITNNVLFESHEEQTNIVHVTVNGTRQSRELINPIADVKFEF